MLINNLFDILKLSQKILLLTNHYIVLLIDEPLNN